MGLQAIHVRILERNYKLHVDTETEEFVRKAASLIEEVSSQYSKRYAYKDGQDLLAMLALEKITTLLQLEEKQSKEGESFIGKLQQIDDLLAKEIQ